MNESQKKELIKMIMIQAEMKQQVMSDNVLQYLFKELKPFGFDQVMKALQKLGKESIYKINLAEIIKRIDDKRPAAQIAWTECPKSEIESKVLTVEQNQAFCEVIAQYESGDKIGAKLAFIERYNQLIDEARQNAEPVKYFFARGFDKQGRKDAIFNAVQEGKYLKDTACKMLGHEFNDEIMAIETDREPVILIEHDVNDVGVERLAELLTMDR